MYLYMDRRSIKFDWNRARAFLVTAEEGSLSAAARALGMAQPTLSRQVSAFEVELGVVLFERVGQGLKLTPSGVQLLEHVRAMGEAANSFSLSSHGQSQSIEGSVCIAASQIYAAYILPPIVAKIREMEPGITIELEVSNQASDLKRREADIAIRNFRPTEPDLIAKKIKDAYGVLYATPDYIEKIGKPKSPYDLKDADFINIDRGWALMDGLNALGFHLTKKNFPILSEDHFVSWELTKKGLGIGLLDRTIGDAEPLVERVLPDMEAIQFPIWLVAHRELNTSPRIRMVFDLLAQELAK